MANGLNIIPKPVIARLGGEVFYKIIIKQKISGNDTSTRFSLNSKQYINNVKVPLGTIIFLQNEDFFIRPYINNPDLSKILWVKEQAYKQIKF